MSISQLPLHAVFHDGVQLADGCACTCWCFTMCAFDSILMAHVEEDALCVASTTLPKLPVPSILPTVKSCRVQARSSGGVSGGGVATVLGIPAVASICGNEDRSCDLMLTVETSILCQHHGAAWSRGRCMPTAAPPTCTLALLAFCSLLWRAKRSMSICARACVHCTEDP